MKLVDGARVTFTVPAYGTKVNDAVLALAPDGHWILCQNQINGRGYEAEHLRGYRYAWSIGWSPVFREGALGVYNLKIVSHNRDWSQGY